MKRTILTILAVITMSGFVYGESGPISCPNTIVPQTISAGATATQDTSIELRRNEGFFSIQPVFTGSGAVTFQYQTSNNDSNWSPAVDIIAGATSGTRYPFPATGVNMFTRYIRLVAVETSTTDTIILTSVNLCLQ
jgi:hypothetical protein